MSGSRTPICIDISDSEDDDIRFSLSNKPSKKKSQNHVPCSSASSSSSSQSAKPLMKEKSDLLSSVNLVPVEVERSSGSKKGNCGLFQDQDKERKLGFFQRQDSKERQYGLFHNQSNGISKKINNLSSGGLSSCSRIPDLSSSSSSNSLSSEQKAIMIVESSSISNSSLSVKRKPSWNISEPSKIRKIFPLLSVKQSSSTSKTFQVESFFSDDDGTNKGAVANLLHVLKTTSTQVLNRVATDHVNSIESATKNCSTSFLESSKCKAVMEMAAQNITNHLDSIQDCITQVIHELKSHSKPQETYSINDSEASSSPAIIESTASCSYRPPSDHETSEIVDTEERNVDKTLQKKIKAYEKLLKKLHRKIEFYRESEVLDDDDEESAYIRQDRLEKKAIQISKLLWKLNNESFNTGRPIQKKILYQGTRYPELNEAVQTFVNKKKFFPDFTDILELVEKTNVECSLAVVDTFSLAKIVFQDIFYEIKERRVQDHELHFDELINGEQLDPAEEDQEWQQRLEQNKIQGQQRIQEVIDHFADIPEKQTNEHSGTENGKSEDDEEEDEEDKSENEDRKSDAEDNISIEVECLSSSDNEHVGKEDEKNGL